jgi:hypothetical protein
LHRDARRGTFLSVNTTIMPALSAPVLWFTLQRTTDGGRACRDYTVRDEAGVPLLTARAFNWGRDIVVATADATPVLTLRRSRMFPLTGRVAVLELPALARIGTVRRSGTFSDAAGRRLGRFRDARRASARAREGILQAAFELVIVAGESVPSGPNSFVLEVDGAAQGSLMHATLPFSMEPAVAAPSRVEQLTRWLPARARSALRIVSAPRGWQFHRSSPTPDDPRMHIAAALFAIELSRW